MSGAVVVLLETQPRSFLKFAEGELGGVLRQEMARTAWLASRGIPVAPTLRQFADEHRVAVLTQALPGESADRCGLPRTRLMRALGRALERLHALPVSDCPFDETLSVRLERARQAVEQGVVNAAHFDARNREVSPRELLERVTANPPAEDLVVVHGDASLSNMIVSPEGDVGFVDCGHVGRADRHLDLGIITAEIAERFGSRWVQVFLEAYGTQSWNSQKAAYYSDLYEFF